MAQIKKLGLRKAAEEEGLASRNLLPIEPWQEVVAAKPGHFARWVSTRAQAGMRNSPAIVVNVRKAHQAIRPVPVVGIAERILLRGLTNWVLGDEIPPPDDQTALYRAFVLGPILARGAETDEWLEFDLDALAGDYVVQADVAAFYQYIDHNVLLSELQMQTENVEGSIHLVNLLAEIQGKSFGIPQLLDPSDRIAEVYMGILERDLRRRGYELWRYNDDFRIVVRGYSLALQALEDLSSVAHSAGLILNESKTSIVKFETYLQRYENLQVAESDEQTHDSSEAGQFEVEASEYSDDDLVAMLEEATSFFDRVDSTEQDSVDLRHLSFDEVKSLRKALNVLGRQLNDGALPHLESIARFVPQLTPFLCNYLIRLAEAEEEEANYLEDWSNIVRWSGGFNAWQRAWLVYVARQCDYTADADCRGWIRSQLSESENTLLHAECALALAQKGAIEFADLDQFLRTQAEPLVPWYLLAIKALPDVPEDRVQAVLQSSPLGRLLLSD